MGKYNKAGDVVVNTRLPNGEWLITENKMTGGGTGHGPFDTYCDGHSIVLNKLRKGSNEVDVGLDAIELYQSGDFIKEVMIEYMEPVRQLKKIVHWE